MLDFYEFLGRGIIAARCGRTSEAIKYLAVAQEISPRNPRVWLWLAAVAEKDAQKRRCLENALQLDPRLEMAKILLARLNPQKREVSRRSSEFSVFTCPQCGGKQYFDPDRMGLICQYCKHLETLLPNNPLEEESDNRINAAGNWAVLESHASCKACGAELSIPADSALLTCPFCASEHIQIQHAGVELVRPSQVGLFSIDSDEARAAIRDWSGEKLPLNTSPAETLRPIYLPFWRFNARVQIRCALPRKIEAQEFSNHDRVINKETGWPYHQAWYEIDFSDRLLYGGHSLSEKEIGLIAPFDLNALSPYAPQILTGWQAELYQIALEDAAVTAQKQMRDAAFEGAARHMLFIDPGNLLQNDVMVFDMGSDLILLPAWIYQYPWKGKTSRVLVNGQTGEVQGKKPGNGLFDLFG